MGKPVKPDEFIRAYFESGYSLYVCSNDIIKFIESNNCEEKSVRVVAEDNKLYIKGYGLTPNPNYKKEMAKYEKELEEIELGKQEAELKRMRKALVEITEKRNCLNQRIDNITNAIHIREEKDNE